MISIINILRALIIVLSCHLGVDPRWHLLTLHREARSSSWWMNALMLTNFPLYSFLPFFLPSRSNSLEFSHKDTTSRLNGPGSIRAFLFCMKWSSNNSKLQCAARFSPHKSRCPTRAIIGECRPSPYLLNDRGTDGMRSLFFPTKYSKWGLYGWNRLNWDTHQHETMWSVLAKAILEQREPLVRLSPHTHEIFLFTGCAF